MSIGPFGAYLLELKLRLGNQFFRNDFKTLFVGKYLFVAYICTRLLNNFSSKGK